MRPILRERFRETRLWKTLRPRVRPLRHAFAALPSLPGRITAAVKAFHHGPLALLFSAGCLLLLYPPLALLSWARILLRRTLGLPPAVVFGPTPILNIAHQADLLRRQGIPARTIVYTTYFITRSFDLNLERLAGHRLTAPYLPPLAFLATLPLFDVYVYFYDGGFLAPPRMNRRERFLELPLLRLAGKRIVFEAYGADVRSRRLCAMWPVSACPECPAPLTHCVCDDTLRERDTTYARDFGDVLLAMGDMHEPVFGSRARPFYWPIDTDHAAPAHPEPHAGPVRIVHAPNHRFFKGTRHIQAAVEELRARGHAVELDLVERVPNEIARARYAAADIVFAQCLLGWVGFTEIEAMAAGKPVVTYVRDPRKYLGLDPADLPFVNATPDTLADRLEPLVRDHALRVEYGRRGRAYVEREWSYPALGPALAAVILEAWSRELWWRPFARKARDLLRGASGYRPGRGDEWPVYSDPALNLARIAHGLYGQPPFGEDGIVRVLHEGRYVENPGTVALVALNAWHRDHAGAPPPTPPLEGHGPSRPPDSHSASPFPAHAGNGDAERQAGYGVHDPSGVQGRSPAPSSLFLRHAEWLRDHLEIDAGGTGRWMYGFSVTGRPTLPARWPSAFAQGLGLSVMLRAFRSSGDAGFRRAAEAAARLFRVPLAEGGILFEAGDAVFFEEYPEDPPSHVLNGSLTGALALLEFAEAAGCLRSRDLARRAAETACAWLPRYEVKEGLRADLAGDCLVNDDYAYFVAAQFDALGERLGDPAFGAAAKRLRAARVRLRIRRFLTGEGPL